MFRHCPGARSFTSPQIIIRDCPFCGEEVEFFEYETEQKCPGCGKTVYREASQTCVTWCSKANECINELFNKGVIDKKRAEELRSLIKK